MRLEKPLMILRAGWINLYSHRWESCGSIFNGLWCSGNTADFDSAISGSNPDSPANIFSCSLVLMRFTKRKATIAVDYAGSSPATRAKKVELPLAKKFG